MVKMEDSYLASSSSGARSGDGELEARFSDLCKFDLALDEDACKQAMTLLTESRSLLQAQSSSFGGGTPDESERFWFACVLFSVKRLGNTKRLGLSQIIRATKLNVVDFCKEMPQFFLKAGHILGALYGADWEKKLEVKELQANFVHLSVLSNYYKRAYESFFMATNADHSKNGVASKVSGCLADYHRFGWLLFILLRVHAFGRSKDLVTCTTALVSVLGFLIVHVPVRHRKFSIFHCPRLVMKSERGVDLITSLCHIYQTSEDETRSLMESITKLIEDILKRKPCLASECKVDSLENLNTDGLVYFDGLLEGESLSSSLLMLETHYHEVIHDKGELDERMFVNDEDSLLGSGSLSGGCMNLSGTKRKFDDIASPAKSVTSALSPLRSCAVSLPNGNMEGHNLKAVATPVSTAMVTVKWLRTVISPLDSEPSMELQCYLSSCDTDLKHEVMYRAHVIVGAIFPYTQTGGANGRLHNPGLMDSIWAQQRKMEALKLYYRVLESMCRAESRILHGGNLTSLLSNERFHRCMLACSAELVLATHKTITMLFPAVLEKTGITAFDLSKVIESFVRHEETLPRELKRHLNSLEERLLENMAWEKGSSMYNSLIIARPALAADISRMGLLAEPMPSLDSIAALYNIRSTIVPNLPPPSPRKVLSSGFVDQNGGFKSPERPRSDNRSVLGECKSFTTPVKDRLASASPMKDNRPNFSTPKSKLSAPLQSAFESPSRLTRAGGETCAEIGIQVFFSKILKLIAIRTKCLCERLQLPPHVLENIYCFIQQILNQRTSLFFNRHIDQLILCSIYGVAKISEVKLTFKEIIGNYRKQPHCKPQVFRSVFIDWSHSKLNGKSGQDHVDVITFYNEIFIPSVKPLLVELGPATANLRTINDPEGQCPESPRLSPFPPLPDISPKKISTTHNVYVSPLRSSKMETLISPSSKSYYACVGESTHSYQSPSKDLTAINNRLKSERKVNVKLNFDVGLVSDSMVASSLYPQNGCTVSRVAPILAPVKCEKADS